MNSLLKEHIEKYICEIESGTVTSSILYCPLSILDSYVTILSSIDVDVWEDLLPYVCVASYIGGVTYGARLDKIERICSGIEEYEFSLPLQNINTEAIEKELSCLLPTHHIATKLHSDAVSYVAYLTISLKEQLNILTEF